MDVQTDRQTDISVAIPRFALRSTYCQILSVDGALATFVLPIPVKTILELFRPAFGVLPKTGDAEPVDLGKPG